VDYYFKIGHGLFLQKKIHLSLETVLPFEATNVSCEGERQTNNTERYFGPQELRAEFDREAAKTGRPRLLLTMAVPAGIEYIDKGYDIPKLNR
jgi:hypothetical protein